MTELNHSYPGRPDYVGPKTGMFGLVHHDQLFEWSPNIVERVEYLGNNKPAHELATRLHCLVHLDLRSEPWYDLWEALASGHYLVLNGERVLAEGNRLFSEGKELLAAGGELGDVGKSLRISGEKLVLWGSGIVNVGFDLTSRAKGLVTDEIASVVLAEIRRLVPDVPWDGKRLVFPGEALS